MILTLLNIVLPVFLVAALGFVFGQRQATPPQMGFINHANIMVFCPALVFSALFTHPVNFIQAWPLVIGGTLIIIIPGLWLLLIRRPAMSRRGFLVAGMFRNTGNIGIPLLMLAYGKDLLGDIILLFVLSNLLHFSLGLFLLSSGANRWSWIRNPNIWAAVFGILLAPFHTYFPAFFGTSVDLVGQITIPLMLFSLGVRLSQDKITDIIPALKINLQFLAAGALTIPIILWLLPLTPDWQRLLVLSVMLPPAVLNFLLCEQYRVSPKRAASVVLLGNVMSIVTIPLIVLATLTWL